MSVIDEIKAERERQDAKWGGPEHDDTHTIREFISLIRDYAGRAHSRDKMFDVEKVRHRLIQVGALVVAAIESLDRKSANKLK